MPFGLHNSPGTFQRAIDVLLTTVRRQFSVVYLDDVAIFSVSADQHIAHVRSVVTLLQRTNVTLKVMKCVFFSGTVDYLGHIIRPGTLEVTEHSRKAIAGLKLPTTVTELRSFFALCNVFPSFVPK